MPPRSRTLQPWLALSRQQGKCNELNGAKRPPRHISLTWGLWGSPSRQRQQSPGWRPPLPGPPLIPFLPSGTPGGSPEAKARWERWPPPTLLGTDSVLQWGQRGARQCPQGQLSPLEAWGHPSTILSLWEIQGAGRPL